MSRPRSQSRQRTLAAIAPLSLAVVVFGVLSFVSEVNRTASFAIGGAVLVCVILRLIVLSRRIKPIRLRLRLIQTVHGLYRMGYVGPDGRVKRASPNRMNEG